MSTFRKNHEQIHESEFLFTVLFFVCVDPGAPIHSY